MTTPDELSRRTHELEAYLPVNSDIPSISPDYARIQTPLMWGGIWQAPGLDLKLRSFATISAQCVNGWDFGLQHQIRVGLTMGTRPSKSREYSSSCCSTPASRPRSTGYSRPKP